MRNRMLTLTSILYLLLCVQSSSASQDYVDWWQVQKDLTNKLLSSETDIAELARKVLSKPPENAYEAMFKLGVLMRTGMNKEAIEAMHELKKLYNRIENHQISSIYYEACDNIISWDIAQAIVEVFAEDISEIALYNRLLEHFIDSGWSVEKIDSWLADKPKGKDNFWIKERLAFNVKHDRGKNLIEELSDNVRENPQDIENAISFLDAMIYARRNNETWDLSWMVKIIKPKLITQAESLASKLSQLLQWSTAKVFYQYALDMELTEDEARQLTMFYQVFVPDEIVRASFKVKIREDLSKCLLNLDMKEQAQKLMVEAADIREEHDLGLNALFSGQVQAASQQRVIEGRILEEEKLSENEPEYWSERARYYRGRDEAALEEEALKKGLALTTPQPEPKRLFKGNRDWRSSLLNDYVRFLKRQNRSAEAVDLLLKEIAEAPADSTSTISAARLLAYDFEKFPSVNKEVLWTWLEKRIKWEYPEERLLWQMLENAIPTEKRNPSEILGNADSEMLDKHLSRAEKLAFNNDPTRANTLGWIENRMGFQKRSITLLKHAYENAEDEELKEKAAFTLLESYLDIGDWENAEKIFPDASERLTPSELPDWYSRVAIAAAKARAYGDAIRLWGRVANLYPAMIGWLDELAETGLKDELKDFYRQMQQKMPSSEVPTKALMILD